MAKLKAVGYLLGCLLSVLCLAEEPVPADTPTEHSGFSLLADLPLKNQIPLFDNRFRIDENVEDITLLLFRRRGSPSVVLVRPDGSKIHFNTARENDVRWHDASNYDLIQINKPMAGPWQAIGRVLPESRIMVLTDIRLEADPLPESLMVGETVKVSARLMDGDKPVNARDFRDVLMLEVILVSTNNAEYDNFGRGVVQVAQLRDDGKGYDEKARDGVFTGEFRLNFVAGEWIPKYIVRTPLYTRELEQKPLVLLRPPVDVQIQPATQAELPHQLDFSITSERIDANSVLLQGRIRYPDGAVENFALHETAAALRHLDVSNRGPGSYILDVSVFGNTADGREFMLNMPEVSFVVDVPVIVAPEHSAVIAEPVTEVQPPETDGAFPWRLVIFINLLILIIGGFAIWFVMQDKKLTDLKFWQKKPAAPEVSATVSGKETDKKMASNVQKNNDMDDILDLSLPDD